MPYKHILIATDSTEHGEAVAERGVALSKVFDARVTLLHVLRHLPEDIPAEAVPPEGIDKVEWLQEQARAHLADFGAKQSIKDFDVRVAVGAPKTEIPRVAAEQGADLIIMGGHGVHGLEVITGTTTDGVVHHAACDVLAVHVAK